MPSKVNSVPSPVEASNGANKITYHNAFPGSAVGKTAMKGHQGDKVLYRANE